MDPHHAAMEAAFLLLPVCDDCNEQVTKLVMFLFCFDVNLDTKEQPQAFSIFKKLTQQAFCFFPSIGFEISQSPIGSTTGSVLRGS